MKTKAFKSKQILLLYLLKSKVYKQVAIKNTFKSSLKEDFTELLVNLKKALQIIFSYHTKNKLILFVGLPENLSLKINSRTLHLSVSKYSKLQGNLNDVSKIMALEEKTAFSFYESKKPYLIVLFDHINMDNVIKESYSAKIPLICITSYNKNFLYLNTYKVSLNFNLLNPLQNLFFVGLSFLLK